MSRIFDSIENDLLVALRATLGIPTGKDEVGLRQLDGLVAQLYGPTEAEFVHVLATFPRVVNPVRDAAHNAYLTALKN